MTRGCWAGECRRFPWPSLGGVLASPPHETLLQKGPSKFGAPREPRWPQSSGGSRCCISSSHGGDCCCDCKCLAAFFWVTTQELVHSRDFSQNVIISTLTASNHTRTTWGPPTVCEQERGLRRGGLVTTAAPGATSSPGGFTLGLPEGVFPGKEKSSQHNLVSPSPIPTSL